MSFASLPTELLAMVISRLPPEDRSTLRKTNRRIHSVVDEEGVVPVDNLRAVEVDFANQKTVKKILYDCDFDSFRVIVYQYFDERLKSIGVVNVNFSHNTCRGQHGLSRFLRQSFHIFCNVGGKWSNHVRKFLRKWNAQPEKYFTLHARLSSSKQPPPELLQLASSLQVIVVDTEPKDNIIPLPDPLDTWLRTMSSPSGPQPIIHLHFHYTLSPQQLDLVNVPLFECFLDDEGAVYMLNKFLDGTLTMNQWVFRMKKNSPLFIEQLEMRYAFNLNDLATSHNSEFVQKCALTRMRLILRPDKNAEFLILCVLDHSHFHLYECNRETLWH